MKEQKEMNEMKASDLRIGSWVEDEYGIPSQVEEIFGNRVLLYANGNRTIAPIDTISGIPLSPEILEQAKNYLTGFDTDWTYNKRLDISVSGRTIATLDYLHELQNFIYITLGAELEINLNAK